MTNFWKKLQPFCIGVASGIGGVLILLIAILARKKSAGTQDPLARLQREKTEEKKTDAFTKLAESKRQEAVDAVSATPARSVAERYEGVGDAVDEGRNRYASRVKARILAAGGRRIDGERTD